MAHIGLRWRYVRVAHIPHPDPAPEVPPDGRAAVLADVDPEALNAMLIAHPIVLREAEAGYRWVAGAASLAAARAVLDGQARIPVVVLRASDDCFAERVEAADELVAPAVIAVGDAARARRWARAVETPRRLATLGLQRVTHAVAARYAGLTRTRYYELRAAQRREENTGASGDD